MACSCAIKESDPLTAASLVYNSRNISYTISKKYIYYSNNTYSASLAPISGKVARHHAADFPLISS